MNEPIPFPKGPMSEAEKSARETLRRVMFADGPNRDAFEAALDELSRYVGPSGADTIARSHIAELRNPNLSPRGRVIQLRLRQTGQS